MQPETAHHATEYALALSGRVPGMPGLLSAFFPAPSHPVNVFGLDFPNPVGLAAGYDKDGLAWKGLAALGFGHIEIGTVTPRPQPGNHNPRVFRLVEDQGVINRMGFPSRGADFVLRQLPKKLPSRTGGPILGINIGKNKLTPLTDAWADYCFLIEKFASRCDYLAINISSPNTPDLRKLQAQDYLPDLLTRITSSRDKQVKFLGYPVPLLVKIAPDLSDDKLETSLQIILSSGIDGLIVSNTTIQRQGLSGQYSQEEGGLSGTPLQNIAVEMLKKVICISGKQLSIISSGGIMTPDDAQLRLEMGADLIQVYTGLIYNGPGLASQILNRL
ncbi:MAG: quinone-dependent dihydroorotate dehydrogenase [Anaerolineales bacterium]|nr:quinone-dependent dihydroorotate dehydrogenase [Anaerolineales bacterium]